MLGDKAVGASVCIFDRPAMVGMLVGALDDGPAGVAGIGMSVGTFVGLAVA